MRLGVLPDNVLERLALGAGVLPPGIFESWFGLMTARTVMAAVKLDIFEALSGGPLAALDVATRCSTSPEATVKLLNALVGLRCLRVKNDRYRLEGSIRHWVLKDGKYSFRDQILLRYLEWRWWEHCEEYVRTGRPLDVHGSMSDDEWGIYQRGMRSGLEIPARWVSRHLPLTVHSRDMLDIGGSHGYFSVAACRRHPRLRSTILDLPGAIPHAAPLLAREGMGDRVVHEAGDIRTKELQPGAYDLVFLSAVVHHFDDATNCALMGRIARALRPGGAVAIWEPLRQGAGGKVRQVGGLMDLFFGLFSKAGTWSPGEIAGWYRKAGLEAAKPRSPRMMPDLALHVGRKQGS